MLIENLLLNEVLIIWIESQKSFHSDLVQAIIILKLHEYPGKYRCISRTVCSSSKLAVY